MHYDAFNLCMREEVKLNSHEKIDKYLKKLMKLRNKDCKFTCYTLRFIYVKLYYLRMREDDVGKR